MVKVVVIEKNGDCKTQELKKCIFSDLYKKCGFRNDNNFQKRISWKIVYKKNNLFINLFAKDNGRATTENKFDLPPPIDSNLYFGNMILIACTNKNTEENCIDLDVDMWCKIYETLMGGFEDITNTDDEEEEEEYVPPELLTKHGYKKDGFIVSDDEDEDDDDEDEDDDDEDEDDDEEDDEDDNDEDDEDDEDDDGEDVVDDEVNENDIIALNNCNNNYNINENVPKRRKRKKQKNKNEDNDSNENENDYEHYLQEESYCEE